MITTCNDIILAVFSIILIAISVINIVYTVFTLARNWKHRFIGSTYPATVRAYVVCFLVQLFINIIIISDLNLAAKIFESFYDTAKIIILDLDYSLLSQCWSSGVWQLSLLSGTYLGSAVFAFLTSVFLAATFIYKTLKPKFKNFWLWRSNRNTVYIFTEPGVKISLRMGDKLKSDKNNVIMVISRNSQKTQEGTEFKDQLIYAGFDVWTENLSKEFASKIVEDAFALKTKKYGNKKVKDGIIQVLGLFTSDDETVKFANIFRKAITENRTFKEIERKYKGSTFETGSGKNILVTEDDLNTLARLNVFVSYQEFDCNHVYEYMKGTYGIMNTLSQYDIVSTNFIMDNPLSKFIDIKKAAESENPEEAIGNMNVSFIGFGKINQAIFEKMASAYQLFGDNILKVNYNILDKDSEELSAKYQCEYSTKEGTIREGYLEKPYLYSITPRLDGQDINDEAVIRKYINDCLKEKSFDPKGMELFIISCGFTNTNTRIAYYLRKELLTIQNSLPEDQKARLDNTYIFVRVGNGETAKLFQESNDYVLSQKQFASSSDEDVKGKIKVITFGDDSFFSDFIHDHFEKQTNYGVELRAVSKLRKTISEEDYLSAAIEFRRWDKDNFEQNIAVLYQAKAKLSLLGLTLNDDYEINEPDGESIIIKAFNAENITEFDSVNLERVEEGSISKKLLEMEHNRWTAHAYMLLKYQMMSVDDFLKLNDNLLIKGINTKSSGKTHNICMTTNKGLEDLENIYKSRKDELIKKVNKNKSKDIDPEKLYEQHLSKLSKLVYDYDAYNMLKFSKITGAIKNGGGIDIRGNQK